MLLQEFKAFINKGNVMDLAVGMIIGSAFTAIVTALVQNILTPLINWIPGAGDTGALQTVLREAVVDEAGNVVTAALILDWGAVISAIITFLCTAIGRKGQRRRSQGRASRRRGCRSSGRRSCPRGRSRARSRRRGQAERKRDVAARDLGRAQKVQQHQRVIDNAIQTKRKRNACACLRFLFT